MNEITTPDGKPRKIEPRPYILLGFDPDDHPVTFRFDADGKLLVSGTGGGGGGGDASAANQLATIGAITTLEERAFGRNGWTRFKTGAAPVEGNWYSIQALTDSVFSVEGPGIDDGAAISLLAGATLPGPFTKITRASGDFIAFLE